MRNFALEHTQDFLVGDVTHLVVLLDDIALLVAASTIFGFHERVTGLVLGADVAVDTRPSLIAFAGVALSHRSVFASGQRAASCRFQALASRRHS